jgi:sporulation protein YlmC with PRC-barrel domain
LELSLLKFSQLVEQIVIGANGFVVGKVKDVVIDPEEWKITHLEVELTKEASQQILGVTPALFDLPRNTLAISALEKGAVCCTEKGITLKVTKDQLALYLRPV